MEIKGISFYFDTCILKTIYKPYESPYFVIIPIILSNGSVTPKFELNLSQPQWQPPLKNLLSPRMKGNLNGYHTPFEGQAKVNP